MIKTDVYINQSKNEKTTKLSHGTLKGSQDTRHISLLHSHNHALEKKLHVQLFPNCFLEAVSEIL